MGNFIRQGLTFNVNNNRIIKVEQYQHDGDVSVWIERKNEVEKYYTISSGEMVMLLNYFQNCKNGTEISDYILKD